jgi:hypothetical protein
VEIKTMKTVLAAVVLFLGLGGSGCGSNATSPSGPLDANAFGQKYKLSANQVSGFQQDSTDPGAYITYTGDELVQSIDGAAGVYTDNGARVEMYQSFAGPSGETANFFAMDFVTDAKATAMFAWEQNDKNATTAIPGYDTSVAVGYGTIGGFIAYAHFKSVYFEVSVGGFGDQSSTCSACPTVAQFLQVLSSKTN